MKTPPLRDEFNMNYKALQTTVKALEEKKPTALLLPHRKLTLKNIMKDKLINLVCCYGAKENIQMNEFIEDG